MTSAAKGEMDAILDALAAELGASVDPDVVLAAECQLSRGYVALVGGRGFFLSHRFGAWEIVERFTAAEATAVEAGPAFGGGGFQVKLLHRGQLLRFGGLEEASARRLASAIARGGGARAEARPAAVAAAAAAARPVASLAATHMPSSPLLAGLGAGSRLSSETPEAAADDEDEDEDEDDDDDDDEDTAARAAEARLAETRRRESPREGRGAAAETPKAAATHAWPWGKVLLRGALSGVVAAGAQAVWVSGRLPPYDGIDYGPMPIFLAFWGTAAIGGALTCGQPTRLISLAVWVLVVGFTQALLLEVGVDPAARLTAAWFVLSWGYLRGREAEGALWKAFMVAIAARIFEDGLELGYMEFGAAIVTATFWTIHFVLENVDRGKGRGV